MHLHPGDIYHIYNRGNLRRTLFFNRANYLYFLRKIRTHLKPVCEIIAYSLMPNHFHLIIQATHASCKNRSGFGNKEIQEFSFQLGVVLNSYTHAINRQNKNVGSLFQQKTKCILIGSVIDGVIIERGENYFIDCVHYVHQNPWKAGLVKDLKEWPYSSFLDYCGLRAGTLCNIELFKKLTGYDMGRFYEESCIRLQRMKT